MANEAFVSDQRGLVVKAITLLCKQINNQRYYVRRGAVNWSQFAFDKYPYAISILIDEASFLRSHNQMIISLEIMMKMRDESEMERDNIDDTGIEELVRDAAKIVGELESQSVPAMLSLGQKDCLVFHVDREHDKIVELSDLSQGVQGIWATFVLDY